MSENDQGAASQNGDSRQRFGTYYLSGLYSATLNNAQAYGYSITVTVALELLSSVRGTPSVLDIFTYAGGAVVAFTLVEIFVYFNVSEEHSEEPVEAQMLGSIFHFLSVGLALAATLVASLILSGLPVWPVGAFAATLVYILVLSLEQSVAELLHSR